MRIAVVGAGAMGMLFGGRLAQAGNDVTMVDVVPELLDTLNKNGISLQDEQGTHAIPVAASKGEDLHEKQELVILFTKTLYSRAALEIAGGYIGDETVVLTLQNGLGNAELVGEYVNQDKILVGVTNYASDVVGTGAIRTQGGGYVRLSAADGKPNEAAERVCEALCDAGFSAEVSPEVLVAIWEKVGFNAALNSTTAICRVPVGGIGSSEEGRRIAFEIAREVAEVAQAYGIAADAKRIQGSMEYAFSHHQDHYTSMAQDVMRKRRTEVDSINGQIVSRAHAKGVDVPYVEAVYLLLKVVESSYAH
jgi:2-dehydropantoate 2-reductase